MQTVLVVWEHGGNLGHVARLLPIVRELRSRGCTVVAATAHPVSMAAHFPEGGIRLIQTPPLALKVADRSHLLTPADIVLGSGLDDPAVAHQAVLGWLYWFDQIKPAAVLVDASPMATFAANFAKLPLVVLGHGFELPPPQGGLNFAPWLDTVQQALANSEQRLRAALDQLTRQLKQHLHQRLHLGNAGGDPAGLPHGFEISASTQTALCTWPELDHFERLPNTPTDADAARYLGPIWSDVSPQSDGPGTHPVAWPDKPGTKVLCYLGLSDKRYDRLFQSLVKQGANVVVVSPTGESWAYEATRGWGVVVHQVPVGLAALLPDCGAVICNGGMGLVGMALHGGKPLMLIPTQLEQALLCFSLIKRGLAVGTLSLNNKAQVHARVETLLHSPVLLERAQTLAQRYQAFEPSQAVNRVVDMLLQRTDTHLAAPQALEMILGLAPLADSPAVERN